MAPALVVTVAACGGTAGTTGSTQIIRNPPRVVSQPAPPLGVGDRVVASADGTCVLVRGDGTRSDLDACPPELTSPGTLGRGYDGACSVFPEVSCPPPSVATCNPPPPQPVPCPEGSPPIPQPTMNPPPPTPPPPPPPTRNPPAPSPNR